MINLLPPDIKQNIIYARRNRHLLRWSGVIFFSITTIITVVFLGHMYINRSVVAYSSQVEGSREALKIQKLEETQKRVDDITSSLKLVLQVLAREVLFSKLIRQVGAAMPESTILTNLQVTKIEGGIDLDAVSVDYKTGTQIQVNLSDPKNKIFDKADIINITCTPVTTSTTPSATATQQINSKYPCQVKIRALFTKNNPFLFINNSPNSAGKKP